MLTTWEYYKAHGHDIPWDIQRKPSVDEWELWRTAINAGYAASKAAGLRAEEWNWQYIIPIDLFLAYIATNSGTIRIDEIKSPEKLTWKQ